MYFAVAAFLLLLLFIRNRLRLQKVLKRHGIMGPPPRFLDGNFFDLPDKNTITKSQWLKEYGPTLGYYIGSRPFILTSDTELIKRILVKDFHFFSQRPMLGIVGGFEASPDMEQALIHPEVDAKRWKEQRSLITKAFSSAKLKTSVPLVNDAIDALLENLEESSHEDKDVDIFDYFQRLTMDTIGRSAFGIHTDVQRNPSDPFFLATKDVFEDKSSHFAHILLFVNMFFTELNYLFFPVRWIQWKIMRFFGVAKLSYQHKVIKKIIAERRKNMLDLTSLWSRNDLLQHMIDARMSYEQMKSIHTSNLVAHVHDTEVTPIETMKSTLERKAVDMTDNEIASNAALFFDAGFETTSTLLGFMAHVLVNDQDTQDRLREEIDELYEREGKIDYNTLSELSFMDSVINETLRFYPPVTDFVSRVAQVDYYYKGIVIPRDCCIDVAVPQLHRDPSFWTEPDKFIPDRFLKDKSLTSSIYFQPFGFGPRNCIGLRFALMEAKMCMARLLKSYKLLAGPRTEIGDIEIKYKPISMTPKKGVFVRVVKV